MPDLNTQTGRAELMRTAATMAAECIRPLIPAPVPAPRSRHATHSDQFFVHCSLEHIYRDERAAWPLIEQMCEQIMRTIWHERFDGFLGFHDGYNHNCRGLVVNANMNPQSLILRIFGVRYE